MYLANLGSLLQSFQLFFGFLLIAYTCAEKDIVFDKEQETVIFNFPNTLPRGPAQLYLKFTGELNDKMKGFYRSKYTTQAGEEKHMGVTQFEVIILVC